MKQKKFTFKIHKPTGRYRSFYSIRVDIKLDGKRVGSFNDNDFRIRLQVIKEDIMEDGNPNCVWKNILLKFKANSIKETKVFLNENIEYILKKYKLYKLED